MKFPEPELIFAYHREEQPGTLLRLEVMNLPSVGDEKITVDGNLLDLNELTGNQAISETENDKTTSDETSSMQAFRLLRF